MSNQQHRIIPPPELVLQWDEECESGNNSEVSNTFDALQWFASKAAAWGANQELEACCEWLHWQNLATHQDLIPSLRFARRPNPPSLKEQALKALDDISIASFEQDAANTIRFALEQLDD